MKHTGEDLVRRLEGETQVKGDRTSGEQTYWLCAPCATQSSTAGRDKVVELGDEMCRIDERCVGRFGSGVPLAGRGHAQPATATISKFCPFRLS
jgi:hypothetical protein